MRWPAVRTMAVKELRSLLRDARMLAVMIVIPVVLGPVVIIIGGDLLVRKTVEEAAKQVTVGVTAAVPAEPVVAALEAAEALEIVHVADAQEAVREGEVDAAVDASPGFEATLSGEGTAELTIFYDTTEPDSTTAHGRVRDALRDGASEAIVRRIEARGLPQSFGRPWNVESKDLATPEELGGFMLGMIIPLISLLLCATYASWPAADLTAGERERGTLETLLLSPVSRLEVVAAKYIAVMVVGTIATTMNIGGMALAVLHLLRHVPEGQVPFAISPGAVALCLPALLPILAGASAACIGVAVMARSYREASSYLTPVVLVLMIPLFPALLPGAELTWKGALVPLYGTALLTRELLSGDLAWGPGALAYAVSWLFAGLVAYWAARVFSREDVVLEEWEPVSWRNVLTQVARRGGWPAPAHGTLLFIVCLLLVYYIGSEWQQTALLPGSCLLLLLIALPAVAAGVLLRVDAPRVFRWRWPTGRQALGSLIAAPGLAAAAGLAWLVQQLVFPAPEALTSAMEKMFQEALSHWPVTLVALALAPALCEETLFRGFLLSSFDPQKRPWRAILISAALFAVAHLTPYRLAPVFVCGIALGYVALRTRSVVPAMVLHGGLNAIALTFAKYAPGWVESVETLSGWWIIAAVAVAVAGLGGGGRLLTGGRWGLAPDGEDDTSP